MVQTPERQLPSLLDADTEIRELPVHGDNVEGIADDATSFIRSVDVELELPNTKPRSILSRSVAYPHIGEILTSTDYELLKVAKLCGAQVVGHTWHLIEVGPNRVGRKYRRMGLPLDHRLVASVDLLRDVRSLDEESAEAIEEIMNQKYYADYDELLDEGSPDSYRGVILANMGSEQFVTGVNVMDGPGAARKLWLPDVEPRLIWAP